MLQQGEAQAHRDQIAQSMLILCLGFSLKESAHLQSRIVETTLDKAQRCARVDMEGCSIAILGFLQSTPSNFGIPHQPCNDVTASPSQTNSSPTKEP
jgi:hypothetical protein